MLKVTKAPQKTLQVDGLEVVIKKTKTSRISLRYSSGVVKVTQPRFLPYSAGIAFVAQQRDWIHQIAAKQQKTQWLPNSADYKKDKKAARKLVEQKVQFWGARLNSRWNKIAIRDQSTRWGSCSSLGNLNFNWKILYLPEELKDYLIIHELCHLEYPNHSQDFWRLVQTQDANFKANRKKLKQLTL